MLRKRTQRQRLIAGMIETVHRHGYADANVSRVIAAAGVSRPTFYEYFADREDCFLATHRELAALLEREVRPALSAAPPERAVQAGVRRLVELAEAFPDRGSLLVNETLAAGWAALDEHDALIDAMAGAVEERLAEAPTGARAPDLPVHTAFSAGRWLLAPALRRGDRHLGVLADELERWVEGYLRPLGEHRWRAVQFGPELAPSPHVTPLALRDAPPLPAGRPRIPSAQVIANQRERIMHATAVLAAEKGYTQTTTADIAAAARVDRRVFYRHFRDRQQAFLAVHELGIQQTMAICASAFFSAGEWPDRVWEGLRASTQFEQANPVIAHLGHVESHAVGAPAIQRIDDTRAAFTIFLQEGDRYASEPPSRLAREAIGGAVFEVGYRQLRQGHSDMLARLVPHAAYLVLAPFMGPARASEFVDAKLAAERSGGD